MDPKVIPLTKAGSLRLEIVLPLLAFVIPFLVSAPQLLTGTLVNCLLFLSVTRALKKTQIAVVVAPSIGATLNGVIFGGFTHFLLYFLPFIWIGNYILITIFKRNSSFAGMMSASVFKTAFLFITALILHNLSLVPVVFITAMGIFQLITAVLGGTLFFAINRFIPSPNVNRGG